MHRPRCEIPYDYFSFGFIRNPWDRLYSCYRRQRGFKKYLHTSFREYLYTVGDVGNSAMWFLEGCDYIGKYETLQASWDDILDSLDIPKQVIPMLNKYGDSSYREHYDSQMIDFIREKNADDIEYGEYTF